MSHRKKILAMLKDGPGTCAELSAEMRVGKSTVSATLQQMLVAGLVSRTPEPVLIWGTPKPMHIYRLPEHANV